MKIVGSSPLIKVLRNSSPDSFEMSGFKIDGAAGETISAQAVLINGETSANVTASASDIRSLDGRRTIPSSCIKLQWVRYVRIEKNSAGIPQDDLVTAAPADIPDAFWEDDSLPVEPNALQPLWIELSVPKNTDSGVYQGEIVVKSSSAVSSLPVTVVIRNFTVPQERSQRVIQWWGIPGRGFEDLKLGSDAYWTHLRRSCEFVNSFRQTDVRVSWDTIEYRKDKNGKVTCDTSNFEKYMDIVLGSGLYAVHFDAVGQHAKFQLEQDTKTIIKDENLEKLKALQKLVKKKGWKGKVLISIADEPFIYSEKSYNELLEYVHKTAPDIGVVEAIESDGYDDLDISVPKLSHLNLWWPHFEELKKQGKKIWFYTCCHPQGRYPNRFLDQPLVAARELHWIQYLYGLDGYLHWGLNWFAPDADPYSGQTSDKWGLPQGDNAVAYPGRNGLTGSIRLSAMRDGLQDYEYLKLLETKLTQLKEKTGDDAKWMDPRQRPLELCKRVVSSFYDHTRSPRELLSTRAAIADEIENLNKTPLLYVQTSPSETTQTPEGPILINIRGIVTPGAKVTVNSREVLPANISNSGYFYDSVFLSSDSSNIEITAQLDGKTTTCTRSFKVIK